MRQETVPTGLVFGCRLLSILRKPSALPALCGRLETLESVHHALHGHTCSTMTSVCQFESSKLNQCFPVTKVLQKASNLQDKVETP